MNIKGIHTFSLTAPATAGYLWDLIADYRYKLVMAVNAVDTKNFEVAGSPTETSYTVEVFVNTPFTITALLRRPWEKEILEVKEIVISDKTFRLASPEK